jgi:succinoglycan biosynthesis transport protein ExoP
VIPRSGEDPYEALSDPKSAISEAYSSLGGALLYSTSDGLPHVMLVTSAQPTEGKSTTCYAIAAGLARIGRRVVLIDADLRRPSLHRRIGIDNSKGLTALLTSQVPVETSVIPSPQKDLDLIPSGPVPPNPTDLIASVRMHAVIEELASKYDVVIIDSPPILGLADAPLMGALTDGVIMVIEADRSRRGHLKASLRRLRAMRPNLLGAALTKYDTKKLSNSYSNYYGYDYYQYKSEDGKTRRRSRKAA